MGKANQKAGLLKFIAMSKKECPSCAMPIDADATVCPICAYEFPRANRLYQIIAIVLVLIFILFFILKLAR